RSPSRLHAALPIYAFNYYPRQPWPGSLSYMHRFSFQVINKMNVQPGEMLTWGPFASGHVKLSPSSSFATNPRVVDGEQKGVDLAQQVTATVSNGVPCQGGIRGIPHLPEHASQQR